MKINIFSANFRKPRCYSNNLFRIGGSRGVLVYIPVSHRGKAGNCIILTFITSGVLYTGRLLFGTLYCLAIELWRGKARWLDLYCFFLVRDNKVRLWWPYIKRRRPTSVENFIRPILIVPTYLYLYRYIRIVKEKNTLIDYGYWILWDILSFPNVR